MSNRHLIDIINQVIWNLNKIYHDLDFKGDIPASLKVHSNMKALEYVSYKLAHQKRSVAKNEKRKRKPETE
jgi:hypothetical protein